MTEPQVWVFMALFATFAFGALGVTSQQFTRILRAEIGKVEVRIDALDAKIDMKVDALDTRIAALDEKLDTKIAALDEKFSAKLDALDTDVNALALHIFGHRD